MGASGGTPVTVPLQVTRGLGTARSASWLSPAIRLRGQRGVRISRAGVRLRRLPPLVRLPQRGGLGPRVLVLVAGFCFPVGVAVVSALPWFRRWPRWPNPARGPYGAVLACPSIASAATGALAARSVPGRAHRRAGSDRAGPLTAVLPPVRPRAGRHRPVGGRVLVGLGLGDRRADLRCDTRWPNHWSGRRTAGATGRKAS